MEGAFTTVGELVGGLLGAFLLSAFFAYLVAFAATDKLNAKVKTARFIGITFIVFGIYRGSSAMNIGEPPLPFLFSTLIDSLGFPLAKFSVFALQGSIGFFGSHFYVKFARSRDLKQSVSR